MESIFINKDLKIKDVKELFNNIEKKSKPIKIIFNNIENYDGSGLQLILYIFILANDFPSDYIIDGVTDSMIEQFKNYGYTYKKRER